MARPKSFEPEEALDRAMDVFWEHGYAGTSIEDLVKATGVGRQSLYDTFGDKPSIYLAALDLYRQRATGRLEEAARSPGSPIALLADLFRTSAENVGCSGRRGCLMVNASLEANACEGTRAHLQKSARALERTFQALLERAEGAGEIPKGRDLRAQARFLVTALHGLRLTAHPTGDDRMVRDVVSVALRAVGAAI